jgi:hypothetical protein
MTSGLKISCLSTLIFLLFGKLDLSAQGNLGREITIDKVNHDRFGHVLEQIATKGGFTFAYNNLTIPADSLVSVSDYHGSVYHFLTIMLGDNYEFKEVPGYIVLRHAPNKMYLMASAEPLNGQQLLIRGRVVMADGNQPLKQVSVYEKTQLVSSLTDDDGEFELKLLNGYTTIELTATKEDYRDTTLRLLREVTVNSNNAKRKYKYYPDGAAGRLAKGFSRFFISSRQRIQSLNLGGFFASSPYQFSLTPGLSTHGMYNSQVIDHFSLNLVGGYTAGISGMELAGMFNIDRKDVHFLQVAGLFNIVGGRMDGVQVAGMYNQVLMRAAGLQLAGGINNTVEFGGGVQLAGIGNIATDAGGVQLAGIFNKANTVHGLQLAALFNQAKKVKGVQFAGLFNIADSSDFPIALVNLITNGRKSLALSLDESQYIHLDLRSGGRVFYGIVGAGYRFDDAAKHAFDIGFGIHLLNKNWLTLDSEYG